METTRIAVKSGRKSVSTFNNLIKRYHIVAGQIGMDRDARTAMLASNYGVESSKELTYYQLCELVGTLERQTPDGIKRCAHNAELDVWRKRVIASIGGWLKKRGTPNNIDLIKGIAVRASGVKHEESGTSSRFNRIPLDRLQSLYNAFLHRKNDFEFIDAVEAYMRLMDVSKRVN
ncbi:MAG: regulatory protein GemA [Prevotellaceae bacterium]|jgi:hypothetical protein|nr:regulatory protein GemA [Prevotellaceae bacterium]